MPPGFFICYPLPQFHWRRFCIRSLSGLSPTNSSSLRYQPSDLLSTCFFPREHRPQPCEYGARGGFEAERRIDDEQSAAAQGQRLLPGMHGNLELQDLANAGGCNSAFERLHYRRLHQRIPQRVDAGREFLVSLDATLRQALKLLCAVERRIDEHQPAPLGRRQKRLE